MNFLRNSIISFMVIATILLLGTRNTAPAIVISGTAPQISQTSPYLQMAEIKQIEKMKTLFEKMIFLREHGQVKVPSKRMTWEGILSSDSPERSACKQVCLKGYGVNATDAGGNNCDNRGWNRCMQLMDWGIFHWHRACKGDYKQECEACWARQTQGCYNADFKRCLDRCPE